MKGSMRIHYDDEGDILEIFAGEPSACIADEVQPGVFIRRDKKTNEPKSITIVGFKKRSKKADVDVLLPIELSMTA